MSEKDPKRSGPWWHWCILALLFGVGGIQWIIDPPVGGLGYVVALVMLGIAATATRKAWFHFHRNHALDPRPGHRTLLIVRKSTNVGKDRENRSMNQPTWSDEQLESRIAGEAGSFLAFAVSNALREKNSTIDDLRRENEFLRKAVEGVRQFAPVEAMSPDATKGYDLASKDLLLQAATGHRHELG
jgi:hypothetical protein